MVEPQLTASGTGTAGWATMRRPGEHLEDAYAEYTDLLMLEAEEVGAALVDLDEPV